VIAIIVSFTLMILASRSLPEGNVYAVFVGLGTAGTVLAEIGLKVISKEKKKEAA